MAAELPPQSGAAGPGRPGPWVGAGPGGPCARTSTTRPCRRRANSPGTGSRRRGVLIDPRDDVAAEVVGAGVAHVCIGLELLDEHVFVEAIDSHRRPRRARVG